MHDEERMKVLQMVSNGILTHEEAEKLLDALEDIPTETMNSTPVHTDASPRKRKWLRYLVTDENTGNEEINLRFPAAFFPRRLVHDMANDGVMDSTVSDGMFLNILGEKDGKRYQLFFE